MVYNACEEGPVKKPNVFLCHSKADKEFVIKLADALRPARVDAWYDDWEIPSGISLREKIFEEGIPECDVFFAYLTDSSIQSTWVKRELDAAFVSDAETKGGFLALFVDCEETRGKLSLDLRGLKLPVLNAESPHGGVLELVARAWEAFGRRRVEEAQKDWKQKKNELEKAVLELKNSVLEKELELERLKGGATVDVDGALSALAGLDIGGDQGWKTGADLFLALKTAFALGVTRDGLQQAVLGVFGYSRHMKMHPEETENSGRTLNLSSQNLLFVD